MFTLDYFFALNIFSIFFLMGNYEWINDYFQFDNEFLTTELNHWVLYPWSLCVRDNILDFEHEIFFNAAAIDNYNVSSRMFIETISLIDIYD